MLRGLHFVEVGGHGWCAGAVAKGGRGGCIAGDRTIGGGSWGGRGRTGGEAGQESKTRCRERVGAVAELCQTRARLLEINKPPASGRGGMTLSAQDDHAPAQIAPSQAIPRPAPHAQPYPILSDTPAHRARLPRLEARCCPPARPWEPLPPPAAPPFSLVLRLSFPVRRPRRGRRGVAHCILTASPLAVSVPASRPLHPRAPSSASDPSPIRGP